MLRIFSRVKDLLVKNPYSREDDIYLTWLYWRELDPDLDNRSMKEFKHLFLTGFFGLPASITRARAQIQNKTNPELKGILSGAERQARTESFRTWYKQNPGVILTEELSMIRSLGDLDQAEKEMRLRKKLQRIDITRKSDKENQFIDTQKNRSMRQFKTKYPGEQYFTIEEFRLAHKRDIKIDQETANKILEYARLLNKQNLIPPKNRRTRIGSVEIFKYSILKEAFNYLT